MKKKLDIYDISIQLVDKEEERAPKVAELRDLEWDYTNEWNKYLLEAPGAAQQIREAQANLRMDQEHPGWREKYHFLTYDVKILNGRIRTLDIISANLRSIGYSEK